MEEIAVEVAEVADVTAEEIAVQIAVAEVSVAEVIAEEIAVQAAAETSTSGDDLSLRNQFFPVVASASP